MKMGRVALFGRRVLRDKDKAKNPKYNTYEEF
jgi:hypothetical protein